MMCDRGVTVTDVTRTTRFRPVARGVVRRATARRATPAGVVQDCVGLCARMCAAPNEENARAGVGFIACVAPLPPSLGVCGTRERTRAWRLRRAHTGATDALAMTRSG